MKNINELNVNKMKQIKGGDAPTVPYTPASSLSTTPATSTPPPPPPQSAGGYTLPPQPQK